METDSVTSPNARSPSGAMRVSVTRYEYGAAAPPDEVRRSCYSPEIRDLPRQLNVGTNSVDAQCSPEQQWRPANRVCSVRTHLPGDHKKSQEHPGHGPWY